MNAPDLADVLAEVNRLRAERGMDPLDAMPKGCRSNAHGCPLVHALGVAAITINGGKWVYVVEYTDGEGAYVDLPSTLAAFAEAFDGGEYPELRA